MPKCKICPFQFVVSCDECEFPLKGNKRKLKIKIWIKRNRCKRVRKKDESLGRYEYKTVIEIEGNEGRKERWKKRALRELRKEFHCNASLRHNQIILSGNFLSSKQKIIQLLSFLFLMLYM